MTLSASLIGAGSLVLPAAASASKTQLQMIQDGGQLQADPVGALSRFRALGANAVRVVVFWYEIAPHPASSKTPKFNATDPNAYPAANWSLWDTIDRTAAADGIKVDFTVAGGAPTWADGPNIAAHYHNAHFAWKPNAKEYGQFVQAMGKRYSGTFTPKGQSSALPRVSMWALWNEPNFGQDLGPQAIDGSRISYAPQMYRNLADAGYRSLVQTGHGHDTILFGEFAALGSAPHLPTSYWPQGLPGDAGQTQPLTFLRTLYCVNSSYQELRGTAAQQVGCPTTAAASRSFRKNNPVLFNASGVGDHPYPSHGTPVNDGKGPNYAAFPDLPNMEAVLDRLNRVYGSGKHYLIYNDEYGYITHPPKAAPYVSPATAAYYINWAEYLSWKSPRIASTMQYLLDDPPPTSGMYSGFASGLYTYNGKPKATLPAYEVPVYMPKTALKAGQSAEVWGEARPAHFMNLDSRKTQTVQIQFQRSGRGAWQTLDTVNANGYFDTHLKFPTSGNLRLSYRYPTSDPFLPITLEGSTLHSRTVKIT